MVKFSEEDLGPVETEREIIFYLYKFYILTKYRRSISRGYTDQVRL